MMKLRSLLSPGRHGRAASLGLLLLRSTAGALLLTQHGWGKLLAFGDRLETFADPIGLGPAVSLGLVTFAEVVCAAALVLGLATRAAAVPVIVAMAVAAFVVHGADPWADKELPLLYLAPAAALLLTGAGRYSLDALLGRR